VCHLTSGGGGSRRGGARSGGGPPKAKTRWQSPLRGWAVSPLSSKCLSPWARCASEREKSAAGRRVGVVHTRDGRKRRGGEDRWCSALDFYVILSLSGVPCLREY
jgi:hypothetical protein